MAQSVKKQTPPILLTHDQIGNLGKYIRQCETETVQTQHYEDQYNECMSDLSKQDTTLDKVLKALAFLAIGYAIGVNH